MRDGKCTRAFFAGKISSAGQVALTPARQHRSGAGIPTGQAGSHAGWAGTCRDETITRLASAWRTSLTRRPVTAIGRGTARDRATHVRPRPDHATRASDGIAPRTFQVHVRQGTADRTARIPRRSSA